MPFKLYIYLGAFVTYCDPILVVSTMPNSSPNPMSDHLIEWSHQDDSNKWSNIEFGQETKELALMEINFMRLIWSSVKLHVSVQTHCQVLRGLLTEVSGNSLILSQSTEGPVSIR